MVPHLIYCFGDRYFDYVDELEKLIWSKMQKYGIQSLIVTTLRMERLKLITKEKSKEAYKGKFKNESGWRAYDGSINDDVESFINNLE